MRRVYSNAKARPRSRLERWWRRRGSWILAGVVLLGLYVSVIVLYGYEFMAVGKGY